MVTMPHDAEEVPQEKRDLVERLSLIELRILCLLSLGWSNSMIGRRVGLSQNTINVRISKIKDKLGLSGRGRETLALFYVEYVLPIDTQGETGEIAPGVKLEQWRKRAREIRAGLRMAGALNSPRHVQVAMMLTDPRYAEKNDVELGALCDPPISRNTYRTYLTAVTRCMQIGSKLKLAVIATLAPFDEPDSA